MTRWGTHTVASVSLAASFVLAAIAGSRADVVTDWNQTAIRATETAAAPVPVQTRVMAIVHAAMFDAVNAIERKYTVYAADFRASKQTSQEAAAASAAHAVLVGLYPEQKAVVDAALATSLAAVPDGSAKTGGMQLGREVAEKVLDIRKNDGWAAQQSYAFSTGPGAYQATPPMSAPPILPQWRNVKPFILTSANQFAFPGPPSAASSAFARDFEEIKRLGSRTSTERTSEQTAIAIHWAGSEVPPLNAVARAAASAKGLNLVDTARLFALLNLSMADSIIAGFEAKYAFNYWRPITAIRTAGSAGNAALVADPTWEPLLVTPPHQEYPSAHSLATGSAVAILQSVFGGDKLSANYISPPLGVLRRWESFSEIEKEVGNARVWGGIHFRTAVEDGSQVGRQVAEYALKTQMRLSTN